MAGVSARSEHFLRENIFLIGNVNCQIVGNKLPNKRQVLKVLFFHLRKSKLTLRESATLAAKETMLFWEKARIPVQSLQKCIEKIEKLHIVWQSIKKNAGKPFNAKKETDFQANIDLVFDIAKAPEFLSDLSPQKLAFLDDQRKPGRHGFISNFESMFELEDDITDEERQFIRERRLQKQRDREKGLIGDLVQLEGSSDSQTDTPGSSYSQEVAEPSAPKKPRGTIHILDEKLVATLDKCAISDRNAMRIISAVAEKCGVDINSLAISKTAIRDGRLKLREKLAMRIKELFTPSELQAAVIHWDGKMLENLTTTGSVDRLAIIVTAGDTEKILSVPALDESTGLAQAEAINEVLQEWGLSDVIKALCCDTTSSNLGCRNGAAVLLEQILGRDLLYLPCRHHILEIVLSGVCDKLVSISTGPEISIFKKFRSQWQDIDITNYKSGLEYDSVATIINDRIDDIDCFIDRILKTETQPRDDYQELLVLCKIFIGKMPKKDVVFYKPGGVSRARWMARAIYCLKMFLFQEQIDLSLEEKEGITQVCIFVVSIYIKPWYTASFAATAPNNDLDLIKELHSYRLVNPKVSELALGKFSNHMWYLAPETAALAFFDQTISPEIKRQMAVNLQKESSVDEFENNMKLPKRFRIVRRF